MGFYRLSITELASTLEVVVELRDTFVEKYPAEFIKNTLRQAATDAIRQRWKMIHPNTDYPPNMPEHFQIEPLADFDRNTVGPGFGPFHFKAPDRCRCVYNQSGFRACVLIENAPLARLLMNWLRGCRMRNESDRDSQCLDIFSNLGLWRRITNQ